MLYDCHFEMTYDKSRVAVNFPNNCFVTSGTAPFEMIDDHLFESVAVSISEENRNGDENTVEVAERQGILGALKKKTEEMTRKTHVGANEIAMP